MSSLTPTSPELPQTSLIPPGSFLILPNFATKVQALVSLFNPDEREKISQEQNKIQKQKTHLTTLLENLKLSQKDYDFSDYEDKLLLSDAEIENILETEIFRKNGELTELGKSFYVYLETLTQGKSEELKRKMNRKLVKELKLEDRVFEIEEGIGKVGGGEKSIKFKNKEQFFQDIKQAGESGILGLNLSVNGLSDNLEASDFIELVKHAGISGIKNLNLWFNKLSKKLEAPDFNELVKQAGLSGIKSLNIGNNGLSEKLEASDFLSLVKQAGESGIRNLNLESNGLSEKLEASDFLKLVKQAGESGIRSLNLCYNNLYDKLEAPDFLSFVKQAGESGIRRLNLIGNVLFEKLKASQKKEINNIAKQYNMQLNYFD